MPRYYTDEEVDKANNAWRAQPQPAGQPRHQAPVMSDAEYRASVKETLAKRFPDPRVTEMADAGGVKMRPGDAARVGFDPTVTRGLAFERGLLQADRRRDFENRIGARNAAEVETIGQPRGPWSEPYTYGSRNGVDFNQTTLYSPEENTRIDDLMTRRDQRSGVAKAFDADIEGQEARILGLKGSLEALRTEYADAGKAGRAETDPFMQAIYSKQRELLTQKATDYQSRLSLAEELAQQSAASRGKAQADAAKAQEELLGIRRNEFGDGRLPNAPQDSALANSDSEMSRSQQAKQQELLAEQQEIKGRAQRENRELLPDEVTRLEAIDTEFKNNQANPDTMSPQRGNVRAEERAAKINDVVEPVKETVEDIKQKAGEAIDAGRAKVADGVQAAADAVKPNRPDNPNAPDVDESRTPGADTDTTNREGLAQATEQERVKTSETPGAQEKSWFQRQAEKFGYGTKERGKATVEQVANVVQDMAPNQADKDRAAIDRQLSQEKTGNKAQDKLDKQVNRLNLQQATAAANNPDLSPEARAQAAQRVESINAGKRRGLLYRLGALASMAPEVGAGTVANFQEFGPFGGFVKNADATGGFLKDLYEEGKDTVTGFVDDPVRQLGKEVFGAASGLASVPGGWGVVAESVADTAQSPDKQFFQNYRENQQQGNFLTTMAKVLEQVPGILDAAERGQTTRNGKPGEYLPALGIGVNRNNPVTPVTAAPPVRPAPPRPPRDWTANVIGPVTGVTDQYQAPPPPAPARGLAATRQPAAPARNAPETLRRDMARADLGVTGQRQPFSSYGAGGQWMGLGGEAKAVPGLENYFGEGKPWTTADSDRLIATQLAERNTPEARFNASLDSVRSQLANGQLAPNEASQMINAIGNAYGKQLDAKALRQGLQGTRDQMTLDAKIAEQADKLLADYFDAENPNKREAATTKLTGIMENDPQSPLAMALMTRAANLSQQNLGPLEGMLVDTANTPFGTTNPMAFEGPLTEQTGNWFDPNGYYDRNGNFVGNPDDLLDPAQQQQLRTLYNLYNQQRYGSGGSDSQANAGPSPEDLAAMAQEQIAKAREQTLEQIAMVREQQEMDKANRKRSGLRRQQGEQWLQQMLYA